MVGLGSTAGWPYRLPRGTFSHHTGANTAFQGLGRRYTDTTQPAGVLHSDLKRETRGIMLLR